MHDPLIDASATHILDALRSGDITPHDLLDVLESRIAEVNPKVNALPTLCFERARSHADAILSKPVGLRGHLGGIPIPIKDLLNVSGVRSTQGSPIFADFVPGTSDMLVERLEEEGGIVYAKSNTSEFGAGANTFNEVFGTTRNPHDVSRSAAGSSGGAAVALATGMAWLAQGSDMGGSLRNPASFCGIVGLRPTPGRVAKGRSFMVDDTLSVEGPMARNVEDVALLLDAMSSDDPRDPLSKPRPPTSFLDFTRSNWRPKCVAYSADLGITPVDREIVAITRAAAIRFNEMGVRVEEGHPDLREAHECFQVLRAQNFAISYAGLLEGHRNLLEPELVWNIEKGLMLSAESIARAQRQRATMMMRARVFFETYDLLLCPATIVAPFPVGTRYPKVCEGTEFETYIDWLAIAYAITLICSPALSLPCGFTTDQMPVGLQLVGRPNGEAQLLAGARLLEAVLALDSTRTRDPREWSGHAERDIS